MDLNYFIKLMKILLDGTKVSLRIFAITLIFAIPLGILVSALSISKNKIISKIIKLYILLMRGTPLLLQIICIYFAPYYLFKFSYNRFIAVIIAFTSISNEVITLVRDTSLAQVIGVTELFAFAQKQANYKFSIIPLLVAGLIYLLISVILTYIFNYTERKLEYYR